MLVLPRDEAVGDVTPPHNIAAEEYVLGAVMLGATVVDNIADELRPADFYRPNHGRVFAAAVELTAAGEPVDAISLAAHLSLNEAGRAWLAGLAAACPATANALHHARLVADAARKRELVAAGQKIAELGHGPAGAREALDEAEQVVYRIAGDRAVSTSATVGEIVAATLPTLEHLRENKRDSLGASSGFPDLDRLTQGFQAGTLTVLASRPSMGKTALAICIAGHLTGRGSPVGFYSLEMSRVELVQRMLAIGARVDLGRLRAPWCLADGEWDEAREAAARIGELPLTIDDAALVRPLELRARVRRLKARTPALALVIVDYLQLMQGDTPTENRVQEVSEISRRLKVMARELDVPVLALSQLSRGVKRPVLSDLRESGAIEQDADVVAFIYRDDYYNSESPQVGVAEVIVAKNRNGPTGTARLAWISGQTRFSSLVRAA